jgi:hypothetical protein
MPLLMTNRWKTPLLKTVGVYFGLKPVCEIWENSQHDPLGICISLPLSINEPWHLRHTQQVVYLERSLREVMDTDLIQKGHLLCKFIYWTRQLETMPESVVRRLLHPIEGGPLPGKIAQ